MRAGLGIGDVAGARHGGVADAGPERPGHDRGRGGQGPRGGGGGRFGGAASRTEVIRELDRDGLLPAITFIFSRVGCEGAVGQLLAHDVRLVSAAEGERNGGCNNDAGTAGAKCAVDFWHVSS